MKNYRLLSAAVTALAVVALASPVSAGWYEDDEDDDEEELEFAVTEIFFELNHTDGDLGIHSMVDGDPWKRLSMYDPRERRMLNIRVNGRLRRQGLTELFFESAEPTFDELDPHAFFKRFPEGEYEVEGLTLDGMPIEGETLVSHAMPAPPAPSVNGQAMVQVCDDEDPDFVELDPLSGAVTISWPAVTLSHPDADGAGAGVQPPVPVEIVNYQVVVEAEVETASGDEFESVFSIILPPDLTEITIPAELLALADEFKYEVLAREATYNQTAVESCFAHE